MASARVGSSRARAFSVSTSSQLNSASSESSLSGAAPARGVLVCGTGGPGAATAELTWGLILALLRHIPEEDHRLKLAGRAGGAALGFGGGWQRTVGTGLDGKRLGVVGLGKQGQRVAEIGRAFGMNGVVWGQDLDPCLAKKAHSQGVSRGGVC